MIGTEKGFLLSRHSFSRQGQTIIELWLSTDNGPVKLSISGERAVFFVEQSQLGLAQNILKPLKSACSSQALTLKTFSQRIVCVLYFTSLQAFYQARTLLTANNIIIYEGNFRLEDRFLMERFVYGSLEFIGEKKQRKKFIEYQNAKIKPSNYVANLKVVSLDIECAEDGELFSIGFYANQANNTCAKVIMVGQAETMRDSSSAAKPLYIEWVENEFKLLQALERYIQHIDPDIIIGWNVINFDFRLLQQRAAKHQLKLRLGRNQSVMAWRDSHTEKNQGFVTLEGRVVIDGIAALKAEVYSFPSFSLEAMAQHFLGKGKASDDVEHRLAQICYDFKHNKQKLAAYNLQDCILVWEIFQKAKLLEFLLFRSQLTGLELDRAGGSVTAFTNLYLPKLHRAGYVSPNLPKGGGLASPGGYVMNSKPGLYKQILVLDFKSLYPSIIRTFKIDPLGLIEGLQQPQNAIEGFRGGCFSRDIHLLPDIITQLWLQRDLAKKDQDQPRSHAIKIIMNSFYGVLGSGGCPFYDTRLASSITLRGQEIMQQSAKWIEEKGLAVIYGDTDSIFVHLNENTSDEKSRAIGLSLAQEINQQWKMKLATEHGIDCHLEIEFETHFTRFLMPTIRGSKHGSKKRYAGLKKIDQQEHLIFKGLENIRTDWTQLAKDFQKQLYHMLFHDQQPADYIRKTVKQTLAGERDSELVYRKRLRRSLKSYIKNSPPHVKAARLADAENLKHGKPLRYQHKGWISYLITVNGPQALESVSANINYQHYVDKQIKPVADGILPFVGLSFKQIVDVQLDLFAR